MNFAVGDGRIVFRTAEGSELLGVAMDQDVAFEVDRVDDADDLRLRPWVSPGKHEVVAIRVTGLTGREFHLVRAWQHMLPPDPA